MALTESPQTDVQEHRGRARVGRAWLAAPAGVVAVVAGTWATGGLLTDSASTAMALTGAWFGVCLLVAVVALWRWRLAAAPLAGAVVLSVAVVGGWLGLSTVDRAVDEDVVTASSSGSTEGAEAVVELAAGGFVADAHDTTGTATVLQRPDGSRVLTLTGFETDAGPDLRLHLVPAGASGVDGGTDLGGLKGNRGDQQYDVPPDAPLGQVVVWCRAFSVAFGSAELQAA